MILLYITNQICGSGGLERVLSIKANYLVDKLEYEVHILTLNQGNQALFYNFSKNIYFYDVSLRGNPLKYIWNYRQKIRKIITKVVPDIISVCDDGLKGLLAPLFFRFPVQFVYERHTVKQAIMSVGNEGLVNRMKNNIVSKLANYGSSLFDRFVVLTKQNSLEWPKAKVVIIPNPTSFYPKKPTSLEHKRVISVGTMSHVKGFDLLLKAWKLVAVKFPDWSLDIYGKPLLKEELTDLSVELGIFDKINLNNPISNIEEKYLESSIYVMSSRYEGFGMVLIEAMACGLPCVSFNCPSGPADIITNNEDGYLVKANDINLLSEKIILLIENETTRQLMGSKARKNVRRYMSVHILCKWDTLFKELIRM